MSSVTPVLEERPGGFNYGYRMNCECGRTSFISGPDYHARSTVDALMPCDHCCRMIHFGPAVAALRDPDDVALDSTRINRLAWYHTSTSPDWPSAAYAAEQRTKLLAAAQPRLPITLPNRTTANRVSPPSGRLSVSQSNAAILFLRVAVMFENQVRRKLVSDPGQMEPPGPPLVLADPSGRPRSVRLPDEAGEPPPYPGAVEVRGRGTEVVPELA